MQQVLVHLVPSPRPVRRWLEWPSYLPVPFHGSPPDEMFHREDRQLCGGGNGRLTGPTELDLTVPDQAKFVICNHTIE